MRSESLTNVPLRRDINDLKTDIFWLRIAILIQLGMTVFLSVKVWGT